MYMQVSTVLEIHARGSAFVCSSDEDNKLFFQILHELNDSILQPKVRLNDNELNFSLTLFLGYRDTVMLVLL